MKRIDEISIKTADFQDLRILTSVWENILRREFLKEVFLTIV
jgi:hypothetical protein